MVAPTLIDGVSSGGTYPAAGGIWAEHGTAAATKTATMSTRLTEVYLLKFMLLENRATEFRGCDAGVSAALTVIREVLLGRRSLDAPSSRPWCNARTTMIGRIRKV